MPKCRVKVPVFKRLRNMFHHSCIDYEIIDEKLSRDSLLFIVSHFKEI